MAKRTRRGQKQCPNCNAWVKGTRAKVCPKCDYQFNGGGETPVQVAPAAAAEKKAGTTLTLEQVKAVAATVNDLGGRDRVDSLLSLIKDVGGARRFKELVDAITLTKGSEDA